MQRDALLRGSRDAAKDENQAAVPASLSSVCVGGNEWPCEGTGKEAGKNSTLHPYVSSSPSTQETMALSYNTVIPTYPSS